MHAYAQQALSISRQSQSAAGMRSHGCSCCLPRSPTAICLLLRRCHCLLLLLQEGPQAVQVGLC